MASTSSPTLAKLPSRTTSTVKSRKNRSTRFIQELDVDVKCRAMRSTPRALRWRRLCQVAQDFTLACLWVA